jgi:hypothetical protein
VDVSILALISDAYAAGTDPMLDNVVERAGVADVVFGALSHKRRAWSVRDRERPVLLLATDLAYFQPDPALWTGARLRPRPAGTGADPLEHAANRAMAVGVTHHIRVTALRSRRLAASSPDCAQQDVFGVPHPEGLCPANPEVRTYVTTLIKDVARYAPASIRIDWLHYIGNPGWPIVDDVDSGYHAASPCFCPYCRKAAAERCDVKSAVDAARARAHARLDGHVEPNVPAWSTESPLLEYARCAARTVTALAVEATRTATDCGVPLYFTRTTGAASRRDTGIDTRLLSGAAWRVQMTVDRVRAQSPPAYGETVCLIPEGKYWTPQDLPLPDIVKAREAGVAELEFQHYDLMPDAYLDRVGRALRD